MTPYFSRTGDDGTTGLLGTERVSKSDIRIETLGTLDELSAVLGFARSLSVDPINFEILKIQEKISQIMAEVAATPENREKFQKIGSNDIAEIEMVINQFSSQIQQPKGFIIPGATSASAAVSMARTLARRSERRLVELMELGYVKNNDIQKYLNRLSSCLYVFEIYMIQNTSSSQNSLSKGNKQ